MATTARRGVWSQLRVSRPAVLAKTLVKWSAEVVTERRLQIDTSGSTLATHRAGGMHLDSNWYEPLNYILLGKCLNALNLKDDDVVFDIGCGLGRVVCALARKRIKKCVGIDLSEDFVARAQANADRMRGRRSPVEVLVADAATADYTGGTAFYLYNSFGAATMDAFLKQVYQSVRQNPRPVRIVYANPMQNQVFEKTSWLSPAGDVRSIWYETCATLWKYVPPQAPEAAAESLCSNAR